MINVIKGLFFVMNARHHLKINRKLNVKIKNIIALFVKNEVKDIGFTTTNGRRC